MDIKDEDKGTAANDKDILAESRDRFAISESAERDIRRDALEDLEFRAGNQWDSKVRKIREFDQRPCLTINRLPQFVRQITNDQRQNRPAIAVSPVDGGADVETAQIFQGIIRHIEQDSNADAAYDTAFQSAVTGGFGYWRIITEYCRPDSFDQDIKIKRVRNPFAVYLDPSRTEADGSDIKWAHIVEDMTKSEYKARWPNSKLANMGDWASVGDNMMDWVASDGCRVVEYFRIVEKPRALVKLVDGTIAWKDKLPKDLPDEAIASTRQSVDQTVEWFIHNGVEILDKTDWLGRYIPVIPVYGDEMDVDGKLILEGIIRHAKDPMRMYNYWASAETELIALAPKAPFIGAEGQFEGREEKWQQANVKSFAFLEYKPKSLNGEVLPPPQRNIQEPPVAAITNARMQASDDLKATTGIYDAALGNRGNERSGRAITARNVQSQTSNYHFIDNLGRAIKFTGRVLVDLIPKIYDAPRLMRIIGEDGATSHVAINGQPEGVDAQKYAKVYDLNAGRYDVVTRAGPSFATKRQQAVESMLDLAQAAPQLVQFAGDLLIKNMDWPGALEISQRLKKTLPPGLAEPEPGQGGAAALPPEVQQQMQQMDQMVQQLTEGLNQAKDELESKQAENQTKERIAAEDRASKERIAAEDRASKERIEFAKLEVDAAIKEKTIDTDAQLAAAEGERNQMTELVRLRAEGEHQAAARQHETENKPVEEDKSQDTISKLEEILKRVDDMRSQPPPAPVINVTLPSPAKRKVGKAIPQKDGSFVMESTEEDDGN